MDEGDKHGNNALMSAANQGKTSMVEFLIRLVCYLRQRIPAIVSRISSRYSSSILLDFAENSMIFLGIKF